VYERLTPPGRKPSLWTLVVTQFISALWHGVFPGYALMFISCAFFFHSSKVFLCLLPWWLNSFVGSLSQCRVLEHCEVPATLLRLPERVAAGSEHITAGLTAVVRRTRQANEREAVGTA